jgi:DNA adenine methylase
MQDLTTFLRYPGSKRRMLDFLRSRLPSPSGIRGRFVEPFVGGGAVFFNLRPRRAILADLNPELIRLYAGIRANPERIWEIYRSYPSHKSGYRSIRALDPSGLTGLQQAARSLFLNRTCFKGMWRHNRKGRFNIGYGGQDRRWAITRRDLIAIAKLLKRATIRCSDFEVIIDSTTADDFLFLDPPYKPGKREEIHQHYIGRQFSYSDHVRLANALKKAHDRGVAWALTISDHGAITRLYKSYAIETIPKGTGTRIGTIAWDSGEVLIRNKG